MCACVFFLLRSVCITLFIIIIAFCPTNHIIRSGTAHAAGHILSYLRKYAKQTSSQQAPLSSPFLSRSGSPASAAAPLPTKTAFLLGTLVTAQFGLCSQSWRTTEPSDFDYHRSKRLSELDAGSIRHAVYRFCLLPFCGCSFRFREGVPRGNGIKSRCLLVVSFPPFLTRQKWGALRHERRNITLTTDVVKMKKPKNYLLSIINNYY